MSNVVNPTKATGKLAKDDGIEGFCLAAGEGSRLRPLSLVTAKPLLAPAGRALLDLSLTGLGAAGAGSVTVNAHHGADQLKTWLDGEASRVGTGGEEPWPAAVRLLREERLLGTGGGLVNAVAHGLLTAPVVLVTCADHVVDPADCRRLAELVAAGAGAAMGLLPASAAGAPFFDLGGDQSSDLDSDLDSGRVRGAAPVRVSDGGGWASAGLYAVAGPLLGELLGPLARRRPVEPVSLLEALLEPLLRSGSLVGMPLDGAMADAGTLDRFLDVTAGLLGGRWPYRLPPGRRAGAAWVADGAIVHPSAALAGPVVVDRHARVGAGATVTTSVLGPGSEVPAGAAVTRSVLGPGAVAAAGVATTGALVAAVG